MTIYEQLTKEARAELDLAIKFYPHDLDNLMQELKSVMNIDDLHFKTVKTIWTFCYGISITDFNMIDFNNLFEFKI